MRQSIMAAALLTLLFVGCSAQASDKNAQPASAAPTTQTQTTEVKLNPTDRPVIVVETTLGKIEIELRPDKAPLTCENFLKLVDKKFYDGLIFHRVIPGFMIQGGDPEGTGRGGPGYNVPAEITDLKHIKGAVATARLGDQVNPKKESSGSQFYITVAPTPHLDNQYTIFGYVIAGQDIADKISEQPRDRTDKPLSTVKLEKVYRKK